VTDTFGRRALRGVGWLFLAAGAVVLLYLVYSLLFTNLQTESEQSDLLEQWQLEVGQLEGTAEPAVAAPPAPATPAPVDPGDAVAVLQFARPGTAEAVVSPEPLFVVSGVAVPDLRRGPGHYPATSLPGVQGNFAVAGHRTTYGAPFYHLDQLNPGDEVFVTDRTGTRYTYRVVSERIVSPHDGSVLGADPLGSGRPMLTLTTCHPRFSNAQRLVVFAELIA
jgi:sortase A